MLQLYGMARDGRGVVNGICGTTRLRAKLPHVCRSLHSDRHDEPARGLLHGLLVQYRNYCCSHSNPLPVVHVHWASKFGLLGLCV